MVVREGTRLVWRPAIDTGRPAVLVAQPVELSIPNRLLELALESKVKGGGVLGGVGPVDDGLPRAVLVVAQVRALPARACGGLLTSSTHLSRPNMHVPLCGFLIPTASGRRWQLPGLPYSPAGSPVEVGEVFADSKHARCGGALNVPAQSRRGGRRQPGTRQVHNTTWAKDAAGNENPLQRSPSGRAVPTPSHPPSAGINKSLTRV